MRLLHLGRVRRFAPELRDTLGRFFFLDDGDRGDARPKPRVRLLGLSKAHAGHSGHSDSSSHPCNFKVVCPQATDIQEMVRVQSLFVQSQMQALTEQAKDLGETVSKSAMDSMKGSKKG
jgi:hypothetical protein